MISDYLGTIQLISFIQLIDVFNLPQIKFNLLSISKLTCTLNCDLVLSHDGRYFKEVCSKKMIGFGRLVHGPYLLEKT